MNSLRMYVLGAPHLERNQETIIIPRRKTLALLTYLVVTGRSHSRDALVTMFWPEQDASGARANLRRELSRIKRVVGDDLLDIDRQQVRLNPSADLWLDLEAFHTRIGDGKSVVPEALEDAISLYTSDFMEGFSLPDCPAFDEWQFFQAEGLRQSLARVLQQLIEDSSQKGDFERGIAYARRWVSLNPLHEPAQRTLIRMYAWSGQRAAALRQYDEVIRLLDEDLGVKPESETTALYEAVRTRQIKASGDHTQPDHALDQAQQTTPMDRPKLEQDIRFCQSFDGTRIAYAVSGEGPPFVKAANYLSHLEFDSNSPVWRHWLEGLSRRHTLIRYDERGCGLSDRDVDELSVDAWAKDLASVVDAMGLERFPLLGLSQGGPVAITYAVQHPEKVSHLILYGTYAVGRFKRSYAPQEIEEGKAMLKIMEVGWGQDNPSFRQLFTSMFLPGGTAEQIDWFNDLQRISTSPEVAIRLETAFYELDVRELLSRVAVPTLILHGRKDRMIPFEEGRQLAAQIPNARFVPLDSQNHILLDFEPAWERFLDEVHHFVEIE